MATVPVPRTWVASENVTATIMNGTTGVKGALDFILSPPRCLVYQTATSSTTSGSTSVITFDTEQYDTDTMHSTSVNTGRITATTTGLYTVYGQVCMASNATGTRTLSLVKNGATTLANARLHTVIATNAYTDLEVDVQMTAGDYVELNMLQTSGGALSTVAGLGNTWFSARWVANS
jgi:hypothetical protein